MKELSIEEKAKAYDEAYKKVAVRFGSNVADEIFLKESEDERIRKDIIWCLKHSGLKESNPINPHVTTTTKDAIAWLEKQGEQKQILDVEIPFGAKDSELQEATYYIPKGFHAEIEGNNVVIKKGEQKPTWSEEDDKMVDHISKDLDELEEKSSWKYIDEQINWLKSLKERVQPKQKWSEEDESHIRYLIECLEHCKKGVALTMTTSTSQEYINWLKSLKDRYTWKPSDEQMIELRRVISGCSYDIEPLVEIEEQLKKLREEDV